MLLSKKSPLFILIFFLVAVFIGNFLINEIEKTEKEISLPSFYFEKPPIILMFVGDIMLDRGVEYMVQKYGNDDWNFPFLKIVDFLKSSDILFGNLEGLISDKGAKVGSIYSFRAEPGAIDGLLFAGFDMVSVANNHIFDYGREAMEDNFNRLKSAGINYVGGGFNEKEAHSSIIKNIKGTKIAFLAYNGVGLKYWFATKDKSGINWLEEEQLVKDIKAAKEIADLVIVSMHFGDEYQFQSNNEQKKFARLAVDSGADLVFGHHPHVAQEIEKYTPMDISREGSKYKEGYIAYSLGNFIFDQNFSEETMQGMLLEVLIEDEKIKKITPFEIKINKYFQPEIAI